MEGLFDRAGHFCHCADPATAERLILGAVSGAAERGRPREIGIDDAVG